MPRPVRKPPPLLPQLQTAPPGPTLRAAGSRCGRTGTASSILAAAASTTALWVSAPPGSETTWPLARSFSSSAAISSGRSRHRFCKSLTESGRALSRSISSHQRAGSSSASRRAASELRVQGFFRRSRTLLTPRMRPPPMVARPVWSCAGRLARTTNRSPGTRGSGSARRNCTICLWPAAISVSSSMATRASTEAVPTCRCASTKSSTLPFTESRMRSSASAIVTGATASEAQSTMPRRTSSWSNSGRFKRDAFARARFGRVCRHRPASAARARPGPPAAASAGRQSAPRRCRGCR